ncbi:unnamed protein product [Effrenium voratum]|nr:unnamed protein product [Effrenium voratum]
MAAPRRVYFALALLPWLIGSEDSCQEDVALLQGRKAAGRHLSSDNWTRPETVHCSGFKCERGCMPYQPPSHHLGASADESGFSFEINMDGTWTSLFLPGATIHGKRTLQYVMNERYNLMRTPYPDYANEADYYMVKLTGKTIMTTIDLKGASCGCNVNFFLVDMPAAEPGQYIYYCDANCVGGNCCNEYDINEMNDKALMATNHNCYGPSGTTECDGIGAPDVKFYPGEYGTGEGNIIDTSRPFNFSHTLDEVIVGENSPENHLIMTVRLWQGSNTVARSVGGVGSALNVQWGNLAAGMSLVFNYWQSEDLTWLDGAACSVPSYCSNQPSTIYNMAIVTNALVTDEGCPENHGQCGDCAWVDEPGADTNDDGSDCWCVCACKRTSNVPRCVSPLYSPPWWR